MQTLSESPGENWCHWMLQKTMHHHQMSTNGPQVVEFLSDFEQMGQHLTEQDVSEWLEADRYDLGYEHLDDDGIVNYVLGQSDSAPDISRVR